MPEEVITMVKIPFSEIERSVRSRHSLPDKLIDVRLEGDALVLCFTEKPSTQSIEMGMSKSSSVRKKRRRKTRRKRNRMKTRGWEIVSRMVNSRGQRCAIYKPFVDALRQTLLPVEQKEVVTKILRSNGNKPSEASIQYFLENTLEYLAEQQNQNSSKE
jgi:hypothetical protein